MRTVIKQSIQLLEMLPDEELVFANELIKRLVLAWDPDFTKLTPKEAEELNQIDTSVSYSFDEVMDAISR